MSGSNNPPDDRDRQKPAHRQEQQGGRQGEQRANRQGRQHDQRRGHGDRNQQQPQQGYQQQGQGYQQPPAGGGGGYGTESGGLGSPASKQYLLGIVGTLLVLAVAIGLVVALLGAVSGPPLVEDTGEQLSEEERQQQQQQRQDSFLFTHVQFGMLFAPYVALGVVGVLGLLAGANHPGTLLNKLVVTVVGVVVGTVLFVVVTDFVLSTQIPGGAEETFYSDQSLAFGNVITNAISVAVGGAVLAAVGVALGDRIQAVGG